MRSVFFLDTGFLIQPDRTEYQFHPAFGVDLPVLNLFEIRSIIQKLNIQTGTT